MEQKGLPYNYAKSELYSYPTIPYGNEYSIIEAPELRNLPNLRFLTIMLSDSCELSIHTILGKKVLDFVRYYIKCIAL